MSRYNSRLLSVRFQDSLGVGITLDKDSAVSIGASNAEWHDAQPTYDREVFDGFAPGRDLAQECSVTVEQKNEAITSAVAARIDDFIHKRNFFSGASSVDPTVWCFEVVYTWDDGTTTTTETHPYCRGARTFSEGMPTNTFGISYTNYQAPTFT